MTERPKPWRKARKRVLKRTVLVRTQRQRGGPAVWARHQCPVDSGRSYMATVCRGPKAAMRPGVFGRGGTPEYAVSDLVGQLQRMGYSGNYRMVTSG